MSNRPVVVESLALESILASNAISVSEFFESIWQVRCAVFSSSGKHHHGKPEDEDLKNPKNNLDETLTKNEDQCSQTNNQNPFDHLIRHGWDVLIRLLEVASHYGENDDGRVLEASYCLDGVCDDEVHGDDNDDNDEKDLFRPILFQAQEPVAPSLAARKYGTNLFSAFLDGCSIVVNHCDGLIGEIAALCDDLQHSFFHAYANAYITPPGFRQAVRAHADDRDVWIIQVVGEKNWKVYRSIPIPYPYPEEQVGKQSHLPVSDSVMDESKNILIQCTLQPGDVLYMPRGYVHEACTNDHCMSFHVTVALATHDWTLAGQLSQIASQLWRNQMDFRMAMHRDIGRLDSSLMDQSVKDALQRDLDRALSLLREHVTVEAIYKAMKHKYTFHNQRAANLRRERIQQMHKKKQSNSEYDDSASTITTPPHSMSGAAAADHVTLDTPLRYATDEEKARVALPLQSHPSSRGLHVRDDIHETLLHILATFKQSSHDAQCFAMRDFSITCRTRNESNQNNNACDLDLLAFARLCVMQGALVVSSSSSSDVRLNSKKRTLHS